MVTGVQTCALPICLVCGTGFLARIADVLSRHGHTFRFVDCAPPHLRIDRPVFTPDWDSVFSTILPRQHQDDALAAVASNYCGIVQAPTGYGKGVIIAMICLLYPKARIDVVTRRSTLVTQLRKDLMTYMPSVGIVTGSNKKQGMRVTVYSAGSLHHSDGMADVLLADEVPELAAPSYADGLARYRYSRNFGFAAEPNGRLDNTDKRLESFFGPIIYQLPYADAVAADLVAPIRVEWVDVNLPHNPVSGVTNKVRRKDVGIWNHQARNEVIARVAASYPPGTQVLARVETIEHGLCLRRLLGWPMVYRSMDKEQLKYFRARGLMTDDEEPLSDKVREQMRLDFRAGTLKKVIANDVWSVGLDAPQLEVVIRCDAGSSHIPNIQIAGRVSRRGKDKGILVDFLDQFDDGFHRKALQRRRSYAGKEFEQVNVGSK
jgi:superfamily II DNA or RNA helicase